MQPSLTLKTNLAKIPGIGQFYQAKLANLGIFTVQDLLYYFPFRYEDLSNQQQIIDLIPGSTVTLTATVWQITKIRTKTGKSLIKATLHDSTGSLAAVWFNQDYLLTVLKPNQVFNFSGKVDYFGNKLNLVNPRFEKFIVGKDLVHTGRLVPIYSETAGLKAAWFRSKIHQLENTFSLEIEEILPKNILHSENLLTRAQALREIHFPTTSVELEKARERLAFEELFFVQLRNLTVEAKTSQNLKKSWKITESALKQFSDLLPFKLTKSQIQAIKEISHDLKKLQPMNRLLQGEVGSGKTVVSAFALLQAKINGFQSALMAPTEILAKQHFNTLKSIFGDSLNVELSTSTSKPKNMYFDIVVGTHALLTEKAFFSNLGLIVVDEQQRFGVGQRQLLRNKGSQVHFLSMTATPIPRTLMLSLSGQLKLTTLDQLPTGKKQISTYFVPKDKRLKAYSFIRKKIEEGGQMFLVCPLINTSESLESVKSATSEYERLKKDVFSELRLGLLHGKLKTSEKDKIISLFREHQIDILVTTPVVEVGIDIPSANLILIEAADRFGLASLHQLRGRVGRLGQKSYCLLFSETNSERTQQRLKMLEKYTNGLELAELDLKLRGPGDIFGSLQHGQIELRTENFLNLNLIERSKKAAEKSLKLGLTSEVKESLSDAFPKKPIFSKD